MDHANSLDEIVAQVVRHVAAEAKWKDLCVARTAFVVVADQIESTVVGFVTFVGKTVAKVVNHVVPYIGWAVGNKGTYLLSRDGGMTWEKQEGSIETKMLLADVAFGSADTGWIVGASGTILRSADAGDSWEFFSGLSYTFEGFKMPAGLEKKIIE